MADSQTSVGEDSIEWHYSKIKSYFDSCFDTVYNPFLEMSDDLVNALLDYVNDDQHTGPKAEETKKFVNEMQIHLVEDTIYCIQLLQGMMQGDGFEDKKALLDDFIDTFSETEDAVIKTAQLKKIIDDFASYNESFVGIHPTITQIHSDVESIASGCDVITRKSYTKPKPADTVTAMDDFVSTDKTSGFVPEFRQNFLDFHDKHSDDIDGSTFKTILDTIVSNLTEIVEGMNNGTFDISRYTGTKGNINWTNITDVLEGKQLEDYLAYMKTYQLYLQGLVDRCQVYKYDPVNMSSGNYINDRVDLTVGGLHKISLRRFYNAQSETKGILGRGWSCLYDTRLTEDLDGKIFITTFDGRSLIYEKTIYGKEEAYLEIHGEEGVLRKTRNGYRITKDDGTYTEYDREGYLRSEGKNDKDYISIIYDTPQIDGEVKPLPVKVVTDDGSYIELFYDSEGYLTKVIDNTDRTLSYGYEIRVIEGKKEYFLTDVAYPNGSIRRYTYNEQGLIDSVLSPDGIVALRNEYDEKRRVTHQIFPDGGEMSYSYDDENNITTATEQNGLKVEYLSDERGRNIGTRYVGVEPGDTAQDVNNSEKVVEEHCTYNERNQKTSVTDRRGYTTRYFYDRHGHLTKVIGPDGLNESYTYNADGKLVNKKDSEGNSYKYTYDLEGNLYSITDPEGNRTRYYYEDGKVTKIKSADRLEVSLSYDENGHIKSITDKAGVTTKYECDSLGRVTATIDALGNRTEYTLDESDNITSVTDPLGNVTRYAYNSANLLEEIINPDGTTKIWAYNEIGKPAFYTDEEDRTTRITYNSSWKEDSITLPNGGEIHYTYDLLGNMICVTDPMGRKTAYSHDKAGNVLTVGSLTTTEDGQKDVTIQTSYTYDKLGRIKTETDGEGNTTNYTYDKNGNVITVTHANGSKTENSYDSMGRLVSTTDPEGNVTSYTYDVSGNLKTTTDPIGVITENHYEGGKLVKVTKKAATDNLTVDLEEIIVNIFEYDDCGRLKKQTETDGLSIEYSYDKAGRTSAVTGSNGRVIKYSYDPMGRVAQTDDCGSITRFTYTGTGKIKSVTDALGNRTEYTYNELDLLSRIERFGDEDVETDTLEENFINRDVSAFPSIDRKGHVTTFEHDLSGKLISETDALGQKTIYSYDERGELASQIDRDGNETIFTRDNAGNIVGISYADGHSVRLKYDALNILQEVEDHLGLTKIESDNLGRCVSVVNPDGEKVSYEYGPNGEKTAIIYPDGKRVEYVYDSLGRLKALRDIKNGKTDTINYTYDVNGHLKERIFPNGTGTTYDYYPGGLLKSLTSTDSKGILDKYEYTYNEKGNRTSITRQRRDLENISGTYAYSYDDLGRLTESTRNGNLQSAYTYDAFGNRTKEISEGVETIYSYDVLDRLIKKEVSGKSQNSEITGGINPVVTTYGYDKRGNLISEYEQEVLTKSYSYNMQDLLEKTVIRNTEADIQTISYAYNYFGQRISKKNGLDEVRYLTDITRDHYNLLAQSINGHTTSFTYDYNVVSFEREGTRNFYQLDELGSTMYLTGTDGAAYNPYAYDPFGNRIDPTTGKKHRTPGFKQNQGYTRDGNIIQPFAFTGYREEENGLYYAQARSYDPLSGRFTSEDKVQGIVIMPETVNHYIYCFNDPTVYVDQNGLWPKILSDIGQGIKDAATGIVNQIKEDPGKFVATVATGIVVGTATAAVAAACVAAAPAGIAAIAVGAVAYGVAGAATGAVSSVVGQVCSKNFNGKINMKEVAISAIGGAAGGAFFGGIAGASASTASAAVSSTAGTAARTIGKYATAFGAGFVGGTAADAASQKMTTGDVNWGHAVGTGIFSGGVAAAGYGLSQTKVGQYVTRPIQRYIYDPIYNATSSGLNTISAGIRTIITKCSAENASSLAEQGYFQDINGRWHRANGQFASNEEVGINNTTSSGNGNQSGNSNGRPTWRQSEIDARNDFQGYDEQVSFKDGEKVPYGTKGSVRPDYYKDGQSVDIKNYNVESQAGRTNLAENIENQYNQRISELPENTHQSVQIDIRGQNVSDAQLQTLYEDIMSRTNGNMTIYFKQ